MEAPSGAATAEPQPLDSGQTIGQETDHPGWFDQPLRVEGATQLRVVSAEPAVAVALLFDPDPAQPGTLTLRIVMQTNPNPLEYRQLQVSKTMRDGEIVPAQTHWAHEVIASELSGTTGRVARIIVQDDHGAELRWRQVGEALILEAVPPEAGGRPVGATEPWYATRPLTFIDYRVFAGGYTDGDTGDVIGDLFVLDFLAAHVNGFFTGDDTHYIGRVVLRTQAWRSEFASVWVEGGGAYWQKLRSDNSAEDEDATWVLGGTGVYRVGDWGAQAHLSYADGPIVMEALGGWQMTRSLGLLIYYQSFDGSSGYGLGLGVDF